MIITETTSTLVFIKNSLGLKSRLGVLDECLVSLKIRIYKTCNPMEVFHFH